MKSHDVPDSVRPTGVARYLARAWPMLPGWVIRDAVRRRDIRVNGARAKADDQVRGGDRLTIYIEEKYFSGALDVLFTDGRLLVVDKPVGLPVDSDGLGVGADTLIARMRAMYPAAALCHRLDTGTGGALIAALDEETHAAVVDAFKRGAVKKTYRAVLIGCPPGGKGDIVHYLRKDAALSRVYLSHEPAQGAVRAALAWRVLDAAYEGRDDLSRVEIDLRTGRTHQIRAQMAYIGYPVLGDDKYGDRAANRLYRAKHPALWCVELRIDGDGPLSAYKNMRFQSPDRFQIGSRRMGI